MRKSVFNLMKALIAQKGFDSDLTYIVTRGLIGDGHVNFQIDDNLKQVLMEAGCGVELSKDKMVQIITFL